MMTRRSKTLAHNELIVLSGFFIALLLVLAPSSAPANQNVRFTTPLPKSTVAAKDTNKIKSIAPVRPSPPAQKEQSPPSGPTPPSRPKFYIVCDGDNLSAIAKKCYGPEEGNKNVNVDRIFKANRRILRSPDEIYVGWKLIIPPLSALEPEQKTNKASSVVSAGILKKIKSIGKTSPSDNSPKTGKSRLYVAKEGDSLWKIAAEQLDNGSRYTEIIELNTDILDDEDNIAVGLRLKLPPR